MRRPRFFISMVLLLVCLFPSYSVVPAPSSDAPAKDRRIRVVTYNVGGQPGESAGELRRIAPVDVIGRSHPDLVFLQECRKEDANSLKIDLRMAHGLFIPYQGKGKAGFAVLSKYPLQQRDVHFFESSPNGLGFVLCDAAVHGRTVRLANIHLDRIQRIQTKEAMPNISWKTALDVVIQELSSETPRCAQVALLLDRLSASDLNPVILAGDFNTIPFGTAVRKVHGRFQDALWPSLNFFSPTYKDLGFPLKPRIDYIFHSPAISTEASGIIRLGSGDHFPVWAELVLNPGHV